MALKDPLVNCSNDLACVGIALHFEMGLLNILPWISFVYHRIQHTIPFLPCDVRDEFLSESALRAEFREAQDGVRTMTYRAIRFAWYSGVRERNVVP